MLYPTDPLRILYDLTGSRNSRWRIPVQHLLKHIHLSYRQHKNEIKKTISMFSGSSYPIILFGMLFDLTGSEKSKMVALTSGIFSLEAAILEFLFPVWSYSILDSCIG
jgi:hypothetical protein